MIFNETWSGAKLKGVLETFQKAYGNGEYKERIPYDTWRGLMKLPQVRIEADLAWGREGLVINFITPKAKDGKSHVVYCTNSSDNGFGRFFYREYLKEKHKMDLSNTNSYTAAESTLSSNTICYDATAVDATTAVSSHDRYWESVSTSGGTVGNWTSTSISITDYSSDISDLNRKIDDLAGQCKEHFNKDKENKKVKGFNFDFGPCGPGVRLSMYGMAIQNVSGEWVSYNPESKDIINVDVFNIPDGGKYMYKMPVAISDVKTGDVVIHNRVPMFVTAVNEDGTIAVTDVRAGESKTILPTKNMFGFNFITKVVSLFNAFTNAPTADQPFGNMLPFLMMGEDNKDIDPMMFMLMMNQSGNTNIFANPMVMYFMMKDNKDIDPMMMMVLMNGGFATGAGK